METIASLDAAVGTLATPIPPTNLDVQAQDVLSNNTTTVEDAAALAAVALVTTAIHEHKRSLSQAAMGLVFELATQLEIERTLVVEGTVEQPLKKILQEHLVEIQAKENGENEDIAALQGTLEQLEALIQACTNEYPSDKYLGRAPGFWTRPGCPQGGHLETEWKTATNMSAYQTINCLQASAVNPKDGLPLPSPACAREVYVQLQLALQERLAYLCDKELEKTQNSPEHSHRRSVSQEYCSCVTKWWKGQSVPRLMVNQVMEGAMVQEASEYLSNSENFCLPQWDASYHPVHNISGALTKDLPLYTSPMRLISNRDIYTKLLVQALLGARTSVMISTCYLFYQDPVQKYVLLDVLPYIAARGVKVYFMMDLFVFESNMLASPFQVKNKPSSEEHPLKKKSEEPVPVPPVHTTPTNTKPLKDGVTELSFLNCLPPESPPAKKAFQTFESQYTLFDELLQLSLDPSSNFEMSFWCARDSKSGFRIKNHSKGMVIDDQWAVFGGSNITPTVRSAIADLDCFVFGEAARAIGDVFWNLWHAVDPTTIRPCVLPGNSNPALAPEHYLLDPANDKPVTFSLLQSTPSSDGEDSIYRVVLEQIEKAQESITVSMGHCCYPQSFVDALERAAARGVQKIQCMVNSYQTNDLRGGQMDLFQSIRVLLERVPSAQVFATHSSATSHGGRPEFLHGKYVVVDGTWSALGSWNLWTRAAFYEIEMELFCESLEVANHLQNKFNKERDENAVLVTLDDCVPGHKFCPKGCLMCKGFGPFFEPILEG